MKLLPDPDYQMALREGWLYQIGWIFGKVPGGGSFSIQKFILQILGTLNRAFWAWNWFKRVISWFRVCFFNNCIDRNQNKTHFEEGTSESPLWNFSEKSSDLVAPPLPQNPILLWKWLNQQVYGDTSISDSLVFLYHHSTFLWWSSWGSPAA